MSLNKIGYKLVNQPFCRIYGLQAFNNDKYKLNN